MNVLKTTSSLCPVCREEVPATVVQEGQMVELHKTCPRHGLFAARISSDVQHYHLSLGREAGRSGEGLESRVEGQGLNVLGDKVGEPVAECGGGGCGSSSSTIEQLSTCVALIEIVHSCNMRCPTCFADSPQQAEVDALTLDQIQDRVQRVIDRKGSLDILQLSGGEPTLHPEFFDVLEWCLAHPQIGHLLLNTNGIRLTSDTFMTRLAQLREQYQKLEIYLQFDGPQVAGQVTLRGADMRTTRRKVLAACEQARIPVNLAMTVDEHNLGFLGDTLRLALESPGVSGICWQPMFGSGRTYSGVNLPSNLVELGTSTPDNSIAIRDQGIVQRPPVERFSVADIIHAVVDQSGGLVCEDDFTPLPCGDPNCHTVGYLLRRGGTLIGLSKFVSLNEVQGFLKDRMNYSLEDLSQCGCDNEPLGQILKQLEIGPESVLRLVIKPFMDVWTYDQHRIDRCCVHVIGEEGSLESFCRHYALR